MKVDTIFEDPSAGGRMRSLRSDLAAAKAKANQIIADFEKYPQLDKQRALAKKIFQEISKLEQEF